MKKKQRMKREMESGRFNGTYNQLHTTNSGTRSCKMDNQRAASSNKGASFIKVLGRDFYKQLQLPEDFTMNLNGYAPRRFIIESGITKKCWRVEVEDDGNGGMYFRDGWSDFVKAHFLEVGNFLLFEYEEQSIFQVRIYYRNGCEKTTLLVDSLKGDKHKPQKAINDEDSEDSEDIEIEPVVVKYRERKTTRLAPRKFGTGIHKTRPASPRTYTRTSMVSKNNMMFSVTIHPHKKHQFYQLTVPKAISVMMNLQSKDEVKLQDTQGNSWNVKLAHHSRDGCVVFVRGWNNFMKDNKVLPKDKLQFEVVSEEVLQVLVKSSSKVEHESDEENGYFNTAKDDQPSSTCVPKDNAVEIVRTSKSVPEDKAVETPEISKKLFFHESESSFSLVWKKSSCSTYLYLPKAVVQGQNLMKKDNIVLRDPEGKCWPLEVKVLTRNHVALTNGWVEFWRGYGLNHGDLVNFEFVSENLIQVSINKAQLEY